MNHTYIIELINQEIQNKETKLEEEYKKVKAVLDRPILDTVIRKFSERTFPDYHGIDDLEYVVLANVNKLDDSVVRNITVLENEIKLLKANREVVETEYESYDQMLKF